MSATLHVSTSDERCGMAGLTLSELTVHLSPQDVKEVGGCGHVDNLHVAVLVLTVELLWFREDPRILITELEVAFHPAGGMLRALAIIAVG